MRPYPTYIEPTGETATTRDDIVRAILERSATGSTVRLALPSFSQKRTIIVSLIRTVLRRTLIITPNIAAQSMWHDRYGRISSPLTEAASLLPGGKIANAVSTLPLSCAPIVVMTLGSLQGGQDGAPESEDRIERLSRHFSRYRYGLVIFDGCEPVPDQWSRLVRMLAAKTSATVVSIIPQQENSTDDSILGIPIPVLIRDGALPVCRNLAYFVDAATTSSTARYPHGDGTNSGHVIDSAEPVAAPANERALLRAHAIDGVRDILLAEQQNVQEQLRAMVLTDAPSSAEAVGDESNRELLHGESVLRALAGDPAIRSMHPILLTGSTLVCHDDLVIPLLSEMQRLINAERWDVRLRRSTHADFSGIEGNGVDWNSRTYVLFAQELLLRGITSCVIADRELVREGWEQTSINTLIDMTRSRRQLFLNQEHSRLQQQRDPSALPLNFWMVVSWNDEEDLHRWKDDVRSLFGPADDGVIEMGAGQFDPAFERCDSTLTSSEYLAANTAALLRSGRRHELAALWSPAMLPGDMPVQCADLLVPEQVPLIPERPQRLRLEGEISRYIERKQSQRMLYTLWGVLAVGSIMSGVLLLSLRSGPFIAAAAACLYGAYVLIHSSRLRRLRPTLVTTPARLYLASLATALFQALKTAGDIPEQTKETDIRITERANGRVRVALAGTDPAAARLFADSFLEMVTSDDRDAPRLPIHTIDVTGIALNDAYRLDSFDGLRVAVGSLGIPSCFRDEPLRRKAFRDAIESVLGGAEQPVEPSDAELRAPALVVEAATRATIWV